MLLNWKSYYVNLYWSYNMSGIRYIWTQRKIFYLVDFAMPSSQFRVVAVAALKGFRVDRRQVQRASFQRVYGCFYEWVPSGSWDSIIFQA